MLSLLRLGATLLAATFGLAGNGIAMPQTGPAPTAEAPVVLVGGCHRDVERHYVPEFGTVTWHFHRSGNCRPVRADAPAQRDCHRNVERHYVREFGASVWHYHRSGSCRPIRAEGPEEQRDCHREVRTHYLPEYGSRVPHRHVGSSCRVRVYRPYEGGPRPDSCIRIGPVQYCEF